MSTSGGAVDALQRERILSGKGRKKPGPKPKGLTKRMVKRFEARLKK